MYLQSIKSVKHNAAKSVNRSILKKSRHIRFGVFIVHSSMRCAIYSIDLHIVHLAESIIRKSYFYICPQNKDTFYTPSCIHSQEFDS
jgi:hypothetical protein